MDRIFLLLATMIFYFLTYGIFVSEYKIPLLLQALLAGSSSAIVIVFIINIFYKVSVHTTAAGILLGMCIVLILSERTIILPLVLALLIAALVGAIRWLLGAHTMGQILLGHSIGILTQIMAYFYLNA